MGKKEHMLRGKKRDKKRRNRGELRGKEKRDKGIEGTY